MDSDSDEIALSKGISASKRAIEAEAPAPKRLRTLTPSIRQQQAEGNSASSMAEQQAAAQQAAAAAAFEQDLVIPASEDDSDVEIIGETPAPDVLVVQLSPEQLAAQRARQQKGKGIAELREPKPDPEQEQGSWEFTEVHFMPLYGLSEQQLAQMKKNAASSSRGISRQRALIEAFEHHKEQQKAEELRLTQQRRAAAAATAAAYDGLLELCGNDGRVAAAAAAAADEEDIVIEDSQEEAEEEEEQQQQQQQQQGSESHGSDADYMPPQQQRQRQQQHQQRQWQQHERPAAEPATPRSGPVQQPAAPQARRQQQQQLLPPHQQQQQQRQQTPRTRPQQSQLQQQQRQQTPRMQQQQPPRMQQQQQQQQSMPEPAQQRMNRKRRAQLHNLEESVLKQQEQLIDPSNKQLLNYIYEAQHLAQGASRPRENAVQAGVLATLSSMGSRMIASYRSKTAGNRPVDLINAIKRRFGRPGLQQQQGSVVGLAAVDWAAVGAAAAAAGLWREAPGVSSMLGPLRQEAKVRKVAQRRQREPVAAQVKPDEDPHANTAETQETDKWVETMKQVLSQHPRVRLVQLVVNHRSFSQTVENIFALSFLVRDMWCRLERDSQLGLLVTTLTKAQRTALADAQKKQQQDGPAAATAAAAAAAADVSSGGAHQFMLTMDMALWKDMCQVVARGDALMPHRDPVV